MTVGVVELGWAGLIDGDERQDAITTRRCLYPTTLRPHLYLVFRMREKTPTHPSILTSSIFLFSLPSLVVAAAVDPLPFFSATFSVTALELFSSPSSALTGPLLSAS